MIRRPRLSPLVVALGGLLAAVLGPAAAQPSKMPVYPEWRDTARKVAEASRDLRQFHVYDALGRALYTMDGLGGVTARTYDGNPHIRLAQYGLLGIGGARTLDALGIRPDVVHLNEGHPALAALERASVHLANGMTLDDALERVRKHVVFTTHTPLQAGNESYPPDQFMDAFGGLCERNSTSF